MQDVGSAEIAVVEPNEDLHPRVRGFIAEVEARCGHNFSLHKKLVTTPQEFDLSIIATNADARRKVFDDLSNHARSRVIIFEKVLFQTHKDIQEVGESLSRSGTRGFVNCGRRGFPGYQQLRTRWSGSGPLNLFVEGNDFGVASNAVHFLDLAEYLNDSVLVEVDSSHLEAGYVPSKRNGQIEVFGTIAARLSNGATVEIACRRLNDAPKLGVSIVGVAGPDLFVDESSRKLVDRGTAATERFEARHVSEMPHLYSEALRSGTTCLTDYDSSARQHRVFLNAMRLHLNLSNTTDDPCPIS